MARILVAGASGRVGSGLVSLLAADGHDVVRASPSTGVDTVSGVGLDAAMQGATIVVDATNIASRDPEIVRRFFEASTDNLLSAGRKSGVMHHLVLSVVGSDRMPGSPYMRGKVAQENRVMEGEIPFTIVRATQFFEFVATFADAFAVNGDVRVPDARLQPIAIADVAAILARHAVDAPKNDIVDIGGPRVFPFREAVSRIANARGDRRPVTASRDVLYFSAALMDDTLLPGPGGELGTTDLEEWLTLKG